MQLLEELIKMAIQSYSDLKTSMGKWLKRADLAATMPDFIMFAEQHFDRKVKTRARRTNFAVTPSTTTVALPSDWGRVISAQYNGHDIGFFPASSDVRKIYCGYQIVGDSLILTVPQLGQKLSIDYYVLIEPLSDTNQSNWLLEDAPDLYLAGSLFEAFSYVRDEQAKGFWQAKRDQLIQDILDDDAESKTPEDQPLVMRAG
jgi:hypothetical protein